MTKGAITSSEIRTYIIVKKWKLLAGSSSNFASPPKSQNDVRAYTHLRPQAAYEVGNQIFVILVNARGSDGKLEFVAVLFLDHTAGPNNIKVGDRERKRLDRRWSEKLTST